jgi:hypothetical protein
MPVLGISIIVFNTHAVTEVAVSPSASITIDGEPFGVPVVPGEKGFIIPKGTVVRSEDENGGQITFTDGVQLNPDPSIAYGFAVIDFGTPSVFGFSFATPIVPTGPGTSVASTLAAGLTDFTDNGITLSPTGADLQTSGVSSTGIGGPYTGMGVDLGPLFTNPGTGGGIPVAYVYGPYAEGIIAGPAGGPFDAMKVEISFGLSGGGDVAALTGSATIIEGLPGDTVPEGGVGLAGIGALAALIAAHRRNRSH